MTEAHLAALDTAKAKLDQTGQSFTYITSVENEITGSKGGVITEVTNANAARMILEGQARLSTQEEIDSHLHRGPSGADLAEVTASVSTPEEIDSHGPSGANPEVTV